MATYKKNFIADVIVRIDFDQIESLAKEDQPTSFEAEIVSRFPIKEPIQRHGVKVEKFKDDIKTEEITSTVWTYKNESKSLIIELTADFLVINCKQYTDYLSLESEIEFVLAAFFKIFDVKSANRLGLRYIDRISLTEDNLFVWDRYINTNLIENLKFIEDANNLRRAMLAYEVALQGDNYLSFKAGIFNSWYPNKLLQKEFFIDCDCYTPIKFNCTEVTNKLKIFHEKCSEYFEKSITNTFRTEILNS